MPFILLVVFIAFSVAPAWAQMSQDAGRPLQGLNPTISLDGLFAAGYFSEAEHLNFGGHDPQQTGFTLQNLELSLGATVDPYARADAHIIYLLEDGESVVEIEEAYITTLALPYRLQLIGGQFFTRFGRLNAQHPHVWDFADQPVINNRLFGPDGLRNPGMHLSWLTPLFFYLELIGSIQNAGGETAVSFLSDSEREVRSFEDLLYMTRLKASWTPFDTVEIVQGISGLFGPNTGGKDTDTEIFGVDFYSKWRPLSAQGGWPFVAVQGEAMWRRYETSQNRSDNLYDRGFYLQGLWGFTRQWVAGARVEYANGGDAENPLGDRRWRFSPNLTFYPSEFSKWRLQYNLDFAEHLNDKALYAVFLQFEFLIGAHGAHQF